VAKIGYARVSTREQNPDHQYDALAAAGCERIFIDKVSGKLARRPQLDAMLEYLRPGDQVVITRLNRLGRSIRNLLDLADLFRKREIDLIALNQGIDSASVGGRLVFNIFAAIGEFEREIIVEGTLDGLASARARGRVGGRKMKMDADKIALARKLYDSKEHTLEFIARQLGVSRTTLYRHLGKQAA
jgi:DNA invertase Pin-like site-specific DNA recombinase